ncbi:MAG: hypothetical protein ACOX8S_11965 [Christensenellales bacterium]|jgi:hypothetical protein
MSTKMQPPNDTETQHSVSIYPIPSSIHLPLHGALQGQHNMLIPLLLKGFKQLAHKNIWHNALMDLTEAAKIVFVGYSFPDADFEMRCLLKKALK